MPRHDLTVRICYLLRHGETEWNAASRLQGQWDSPLTPRGRAHAATAAALLARLGVDRVYASPLGRARETIALMSESLPPPIFDDRLKEWSAGDWSGELHADIRVKWPAEWAAWDADRYNNRSPNGESFGDMIARARSFLADVAHDPGARVAIVGHGFMNRALAAVLLSLSPAETLAIHQRNDMLIRVVMADAGPVVDYFVGAAGPWPGLPTAASAVTEGG
jgi:broad specificity phosphatase PhoE